MCGNHAILLQAGDAGHRRAGGRARGLLGFAFRFAQRVQFLHLGGSRIAKFAVLVLGNSLAFLPGGERRTSERQRRHGDDATQHEYTVLHVVFSLRKIYVSRYNFSFPVTRAG
ncbi:MAG: hypothetical protein EOO64_05645 [Massilia sp.]|nr:MAG: hypothetical protein EOO64_05645 [Massilia sp.]